MRGWPRVPLPLLPNRPGSSSAWSSASAVSATAECGEELSFDVVMRRGTFGAPLIVSIDGTQVFALDAAKILKDWERHTSPVFSVGPGAHALAFTLGDGPAGHVLIDNVAITFRK